MPWFPFLRDMLNRSPKNDDAPSDQGDSDTDHKDSDNDNDYDNSLISVEGLHYKYWDTQCDDLYSNSENIVPGQGSFMHTVTFEDIPTDPNGTYKLTLPLYCNNDGNDELELCQSAAFNIRVEGPFLQATLYVGLALIQEIVHPYQDPQFTLPLPMLQHHRVDIHVKGEGPIKVRMDMYTLANPSKVYDYWFQCPYYNYYTVGKEIRGILEEWTLFSTTVWFNHPASSLAIYNLPKQCLCVKLVVNDTECVKQFTYQGNGEWILDFSPFTVNFSRIDRAVVEFLYPSSSPEFKICIKEIAYQKFCVKQGMGGIRYGC